MTVATLVTVTWQLAPVYCYHAVQQEWVSGDQETCLADSLRN